jgi:hypothetical protein
MGFLRKTVRTAWGFAEPALDHSIGSWGRRRIVGVGWWTDGLSRPFRKSGRRMDGVGADLDRDFCRYPRLGAMGLRRTWGTPGLRLSGDGTYRLVYPTLIAQNAMKVGHPFYIGDPGGDSHLALMRRKGSGVRPWCCMEQKSLSHCKLRAGAGVYMGDGSRHCNGSDEHGDR